MIKPGLQNGQTKNELPGTAARVLKGPRVPVIEFNAAQRYTTVAAAVLLPLPATLLVSVDQTIIGAITTMGASFWLAARRARLAVNLRTTERYSLGIDAILFVLVAIISGVVAGTVISPGDSKLFRLRYSGFAGEADIAPSYLVILWCLSLCTLASQGVRPHRIATEPFQLNQRTLLALGLLGSLGLALSLTVSRYEAFSSRGEGGGNGLSSLLYWSASVFVAYVVLMQQRRGPKLNIVAATIMGVGLLVSGNRSPVALIGIALLVRLVRGRRHNLIKLFAMLIPIGLTVFSYQSIWRSLVSKGLPSGPADVFNIMMSDPLQEFLRLGLDTVDGHTLVSGLIDQGFTARWLDPLLAVANFVPRQLWEDKPTLLGSTIGEDYLGLSAGGIFLSGPGYFSLVSGSLIGGSALFVCLVLTLKRIASLSRIHPLIICAIYYLVARISIAGDAFDIFLSVQVVFIFGIATLIGKGLPWRRS